MGEQLARFLVVAAAGYLTLGACFAVPFVASWVGRLDPAARHGTWGFRILIVPGTVLFWPMLAARLWRTR